MTPDSPGRSIAKALSWRVIATLVTATVAYAVTREIELAAAIGAVDTLIKLLAYYGHERLWNRICLGRDRPPETNV